MFYAASLRKKNINNYTKMLQLNSTKNALDFSMLSDAFVREKMSVVGLQLKNDLIGKPSLN